MLDFSSELNLVPRSDSNWKSKKIVSAEVAVQAIQNGDCVVTGGFVGNGFPEALAIKLKERFLNNSEPRDLTLVYAAGQGDGKERGLNHLGHEGLLKRVIGGHWGLVPKLQKLALENKIEAYNLPQGCISHLYRDIAAKKPGVLTHVGLDTFVDPRHGGGKMNSRTTEDLVSILHIGSEEYLFYKSIPLNIALLRGTTADPDGNITMEREALTLESLAIAMAVHNNGGKVIVQVERLAERASLNSRDVRIPGVLVDFVVVSEPEHHWQTFATAYSPIFSGESRISLEQIPQMKMSNRKIIARRAAMELKAGQIVNLGIGMPEGVANVACEEGFLDGITLTAEPGVIGGVPVGGLDFGAAMNAHAIIDQPAQFDFYDGGGLDIAFLGLAQCDRFGNVNVSKFGNKLAGSGGFINISQNAKEIVFLATFLTEFRSNPSASNSCLCKFVADVEHRTFSSSYALQKNKKVLFVTDRCVLRLTAQGLELIEIAPGLDLEKDILSHMEFRPLIAENLKTMDERIFQSPSMGHRLMKYE